MVIIKQDDMQFVFLKGNAFLLKGRILIILDYWNYEPASFLRSPKIPFILPHNLRISDALSPCSLKSFQLAGNIQF